MGFRGLGFRVSHRGSSGSGAVEVTRELLRIDPEAQLKPCRQQGFNIGALIITYAVLGVPYYNYSTMGPKTPLKLLRASQVSKSWDSGSAFREV